MKRISIYSILLVFVLGLYSCNFLEPFTEGPTDNENVVDFLTSAVATYYLWVDDISDSTTYSYNDDPFELFDKLMYKKDKWSYLTDDYAAMIADYQGVSTTFGWRMAIGTMVDENQEPSGAYFGIILFVYENSPAANAGFKRGDVIISLNGGSITDNNYSDFYYASSLTCGTAKVVDNALVPNNDSHTLTAVEMYCNPIQDFRVIEQGGKKIGYLCYTDYVNEAKNTLAEIFRNFQQEGVDDVVLDLRCNGGGASIAALDLCAMLAPDVVLNGTTLFLQHQWNQSVMDYYQNQGAANTLNLYFPVRDSVQTNLNLNRLYILTTGNTASASEATAIGLEPYLDEVRIGGNTYGKYCGAALMNATTEGITNWGMSLVVYRFANADGLTDFEDGLAPDHEVSENYLGLKPFGDTSDPLLSKALEIITGVPAATVTSVNQPRVAIRSDLQPPMKPSEILLR